ncbi:MAG: sulfite exporter TauE/SafE family protein [Gemmatimonadota bacterium]|nr:sulfite exporter TauE/SafE family protein [Gemmatimonadota bacterium]
MESQLEWSVILLATLAVTVGATIQAVVGFGVAMVAAPILLLLDPRLVPGPLLASSIALSLLMTHRHWHGLEGRWVRLAVSGGVPGIILGASVIALIPIRTAAVVIASLVLLGVVMSAAGHRVKLNTKSLLLAGAASGFMATIASIGGPPLALLLQDEEGDTLRGTMAAFFTALGVVSVSALAFVGRFGQEEWLITAPMIPGILLGFYLGNHLTSRIDKGVTRIALLWICALTASAAVVKYGFFYG